MKDKLFKLGTLHWMIGISAVIFFALSSLRHAMFHSGAFDLGIYDQVVYLISQGQPPISSFLGFHHLGNHAAWSVYPLGLLYKIYSDVHWLFAVQAVALALGAWPTWSLARLAGLSEAQALAMAAVYLLYPVVFNVNMFDFHPEVMALPVLLGTILAARLNRVWWFTFAILFVVGCKEVLSLTIAAMGIWLFFFEKKRRCGAIALFVGAAWFLITSRVIIPTFSGAEPAAVYRYSYLGDSVPEIAKNLFLKPGLLLEGINIRDSLRYLFQVFLPVIWGLLPQHLAPMVSALPALVLNVLSVDPQQRNLGVQYTLPVLPFLLLAVIPTLRAGQVWSRNSRLIILWSFLCFLALANYKDYWTTYPTTLDTWQAKREAIAQIQTKGGVLTTNRLAPHLTHRPLVKLVFSETPTADVVNASSVNLTQIDYVLLDAAHSGWLRTKEFTANLVSQFKKNESFQLRYQRDDIYLFVKKPKGSVGQLNSSRPLVNHVSEQGKHGSLSGGDKENERPLGQILSDEDILNQGKHATQ